MDRAALGKRGLLDVARSVLRGGARVLQYRAKGISDVRAFADCQALAKLCRRHKALFIVNDRPDIALSSGAHGVHLGTEDLPIAAARKALGPDTIIGLSSHSVAEALRQARKKPDYVALGPVFRSRSKKTGRRLLGLAAVREASRRLQCPLVGIGGIDAKTAGAVAAAGAGAVAVIDAVLGARKPEKAAKILSEVIARGAKRVSDEATSK